MYHTDYTQITHRLHTDYTQIDVMHPIGYCKNIYRQNSKRRKYVVQRTRYIDIDQQRLSHLDGWLKSLITIAMSI